MRIAVLTISTLALVAGGWLAVASVKRSEELALTPLAPVVHSLFDPAKIDRDIAFHKGRVEGDPKGALGWSMLSAAYLAKSKEFDSDAAAWEAEAAARKSLELRRKNNVSAARRLVSSLLEQHRFQDALLSADEALAIAPGDPGATGVKIDCLMEVGRLDEAQALIAKTPADDDSFLPYRARLASLKGRHEEAIALLRKAYAGLESNMDVAEPSLAWFKVKIATEQLALGQIDASEQSLKAALKFHTRNYKADLVLAKLALQRRQWTTAGKWAKATLTIADSMEAKTLLYKAAMGSGDMETASRWKQAVIAQWTAEDTKFEQLGKGGPLHVRPEDRAFATFCREAALTLPEAKVAAQRDLANRPDDLAKLNASALLGSSADGTRQ